MSRPFTVHKNLMPLGDAFHLPQIQMRRGAVTKPPPPILGGSKENSPEEQLRTRLPALRSAAYQRPIAHQKDSSPALEKSSLRLSAGLGASGHGPFALPLSPCLSAVCSTNAGSTGSSYVATPLQLSQTGMCVGSPIVEGLAGIPPREVEPKIVSMFKYKGGEMTIINRMIRMYTSHNLGSIYELRRLILGGERLS